MIEVISKGYEAKDLELGPSFYLSQGVKEFYSVTNGLYVPELDTEILSLVDALIDDLEAEVISDSVMQAEADEGISELLPGLSSDIDSDESLIISSLVPACSTVMLIQLLGTTDMWIREAAAEECGRRIVTEARLQLQKLAAAGTNQDNRAARTSLSKINQSLFSKT